MRASDEQVDKRSRTIDECSREELVKARLTTLLADLADFADLGDLPMSVANSLSCGSQVAPDLAGVPDAGPYPGSYPGSYGAPARPNARSQAFTRLLDDLCPAGAVLLHNKTLPGSRLHLDHLVVAPRGLVVVSPEWAPAEPAANAGAAAGTAGAGIPRASRTLRKRRSAVVRDALGRTIALRTWLAATVWAATPVLTAICVAPAVAPVTGPPVLIEGVWLGAIERLGPWLGSGTTLAAPRRGALAYFLATELD
ncbi:MAG TPA: hypothetical protein VL984_13750 [Acidimicrobiales bacterium]|nr:hypothetical protein [Acidimicrobiales bacterium]